MTEIDLTVSIKVTQADRKAAASVAVISACGQPRQHTDRPLIALASYAGQYAPQSRVSWAGWKCLLDAADKAGLINGGAK